MADVETLDPGAVERFKADMAAARDAVPQFPVPVHGPLSGAHGLVDEILSVVLRAWKGREPEWFQTAAGRRVGELDADERALVVLAALERAVWGARQPDSASAAVGVANYVLRRIIRDLLELGLPLRTEHRRQMLDILLRLEDGAYRLWQLPMHDVVPLIAEGFAEPGADEVLRPGAVRLRILLLPDAFHNAVTRELTRTLEAALLGGRSALLMPFEPWTARVVEELETMEAAQRAHWVPLLEHVVSLTSAQPSAKWTKTLRGLVAAVGADAFRSRAAEWIGAMREGTEQPMDARNADFARGLAWCLAALGTDEDARLVGDMALLCAAKIPGVGQRSTKVMNGCIAALGEMPGDAAMAQITRLRARVKYAQAQALIEKTLLAAAARRGCAPGELEELAVPLFGMDEPGLLRLELDGWIGEVRITGTTSVQSAWIAPGGARQKSVPAPLKASHGEELKALRKAEKEMQDALSAQRARLEALPLEARSIPYAAWRERYIDHPLLAPMCRRLLWRFESADGSLSGGWLQGEMVDADDRPLRVDASAAVRPWHPIDATAGETAAWRAWLDRHGVTQPFKQAHREVYRLTDAERDTRIYSNRFAAHVLRQHQLAALARGRGWQYQLQGAYDRWSAPTLRLSGYGLRVELWVDPVLDHEADSGVSLYVTTDQVRFLDGRDQPVPLETVPPLVFSEAMRDVDLFVGVASVGTDPTWVDGGPLGAGEYWTAFAFGELSATARTRREVLERLLPRLRIAGQCELDDRFLVVRGALRTYRIHLGSGNVLMEPGSEYLCIVPDRRPTAVQREADTPTLPFEGDALLSLILSKAFLLAADTAITDRTILRQIRVGV